MILKKLASYTYKLRGFLSIYLRFFRNQSRSFFYSHVLLIVLICFYSFIFFGPIYDLWCYSNEKKDCELAKQFKFNTPEERKISRCLIFVLCHTESSGYYEGNCMLLPLADMHELLNFELVRASHFVEPFVKVYAQS